MTFNTKISFRFDKLHHSERPSAIVLVFTPQCNGLYTDLKPIPYKLDIPHVPSTTEKHPLEIKFDSRTHVIASGMQNSFITPNNVLSRVPSGKYARLAAGKTGSLDWKIQNLFLKGDESIVVINGTENPVTTDLGFTRTEDGIAIAWPLLKLPQLQSEDGVAAGPLVHLQIYLDRKGGFPRGILENEGVLRNYEPLFFDKGRPKPVDLRNLRDHDTCWLLIKKPDGKYQLEEQYSMPGPRDDPRDIPSQPATTGSGNDKGNQNQGGGSGTSSPAGTKLPTGGERGGTPSTNGSHAGDPTKQPVEIIVNIPGEGPKGTDTTSPSGSSVSSPGGGTTRATTPEPSSHGGSNGGEGAKPSEGGKIPPATPVSPDTGNAPSHDPVSPPDDRSGPQQPESPSTKPSSGTTPAPTTNTPPATNTPPTTNTPPGTNQTTTPTTTGNDPSAGIKDNDPKNPRTDPEPQPKLPVVPQPSGGSNEDIDLHPLVHKLRTLADFIHLGIHLNLGLEWKKEVRTLISEDWEQGLAAFASNKVFERVSSTGH